MTCAQVHEGDGDGVMSGLRSPSLDSALRASLRLSKIAPGNFVAVLTPTYETNLPYANR